jgi:hypothetical protein
VKQKEIGNSPDCWEDDVKTKALAVLGLLLKVSKNTDLGKLSRHPLVIVAAVGLMILVFYFSFSPYQRWSDPLKVVQIC